MNNKLFTPEQEQKIVNLYKNLTTYTDIAKEFGTSKQVIYGYIQQNFTEKQIREIKRKRAEINIAGRNARYFAKRKTIS